jgi:hypothetical protein
VVAIERYVSLSDKGFELIRYCLESELPAYIHKDVNLIYGVFKMNISKLNKGSVNKIAPKQKAEPMICNWIYVIFGL